MIGRRVQQLCIGLRFGCLLACLLLSGVTSAQQGLTRSADRAIAITQPRDQSTVFDNSGDVEVRLSIAPAPGTAADEHIELLLDGQPQPPQPPQEQGYVLHHVDRGAHRLQARIVDDRGRTLIESSPVTFYLWQASRNFPSRR